jgi:hypothetical protein
MLNSPFTFREPKDFRILLFYPNLHMSALMPQVIGILTALFKKEGYTLGGEAMHTKLGIEFDAIYRNKDAAIVDLHG